MKTPRELSLILPIPMILSLLQRRKTHISIPFKKESEFLHLKFGDMIWVKEDQKLGYKDRFKPIALYKANNTIVHDNKKANLVFWNYKTPEVPAISMQRSLSRITLIVKEVRIQMLQDISKEDAIEEGVIANELGVYWLSDNNSVKIHSTYSPIWTFWSYWDSIYKKLPSSSNPKIITVCFEVKFSNIDIYKQSIGDANQ